ncbi:hypothetical protein MPL1032_10202 [Mesorhizobium plurifarium]|uniref:Uncharacterized protein n=1 Tax=Mesorhizobium plurifarium TaxID=69974 RepID=A0A0K2VNC6_MESPL|nr:hypothetical protein MPL1032_10202 [Mesorhizobium plurifarium]
MGMPFLERNGAGQYALTAPKTPMKLPATSVYHDPYICRHAEDSKASRLFTFSGAV